MPHKVLLFFADIYCVRWPLSVTANTRTPRQCRIPRYCRTSGHYRISRLNRIPRHYRILRRYRTPRHDISFRHCRIPWQSRIPRYYRTPRHHRAFMVLQKVHGTTELHGPIEFHITAELLGKHQKIVV